MTDPLINAALDYLDPDMTHFFIGNQAVRQALLDGTKLHILAETFGAVGSNSLTI